MKMKKIFQRMTLILAGIALSTFSFGSCKSSKMADQQRRIEAEREAEQKAALQADSVNLERQRAMLAARLDRLGIKQDLSGLNRRQLDSLYNKVEVLEMERTKCLYGGPNMRKRR